MRRVRVRVSGRVQGVFFRDSTRRTAEALGLGGWVRNCDDGSVEALFEGEDGDVARALAWLREGPTHARVDAVEVRDEPPQGCTSEFEIRRG